MDQRIFSKIVSEDIKKRSTEEQREMLRSPQFAQRWRDEVESIRMNATGQIEDLERDFKAQEARLRKMGETAAIAIAQAETQGKVDKIKRFIFHVDKTLLEADRIVSKMDVPEGQSDDRADFLEAAIREHMRIADEAEIEPEPHDTALYRAINGEWLFDSISL